MGQTLPPLQASTTTILPTCLSVWSAVGAAVLQPAGRVIKNAPITVTAVAFLYGSRAVGH